VATADPPPRPAWVTVSPTPTLAWLEPRASYGDAEPPPDVLRRNAETVVRQWSVPLVIGAKRAAIEGDVVWVPTRADQTTASRGGSSAVRAFVAVSVVSALLLGAMATVARRRGQRRAAG
jgi:hypothetical protein